MANVVVSGVMTGGGGPGRPEVTGSASLLGSLTADETREIREYEKLLRFRDEVISGCHPRIKPAHLVGKLAQVQNPPSAPASAAPASLRPVAKHAAAGGRAVADNPQSHQANQQRPPVNMASNLPGLGSLPSAPGGARPLGSGKPEIDPVLLEKSDDLIKAEIQLQRQRVERSLKDELEQRRTANKALEQLAELDVADIMAKAMSLVHATPAAQSTDDTAANGSASSDSFDDNTFYSSRHDTPESNMAARLPNEPEDEEMREGSPYEPELDIEPVSQAQPVQPPPSLTQVLSRADRPQTQQLPSAPTFSQASSTPAVTVPGLSIVASSSTTGGQSRVPGAAGATQNIAGTRLEESVRPEGGPRAGTHEAARTSERLLDQAAVREPPLVRAHDLSPLAPQPTHVIPPAIAREAQLAPAESSAGPQAAPAQVAALRKQTSNGSSRESSPQGSRPAEKKKNKKKKRKADRLAAETAAASPYIKPEPHSPSPLTPQYARPTKRQRHSHQQLVEINDDEVRYEQSVPAEDDYRDRYEPRVVRQERVVGYERADDYRPRHGEEPVLVTSPRYERVYYDDYRVPPPGSYTAGPASTQYVPREARAVRPASRVVEGPYEDGAAPYYRDVRAASRMSVRPTAFPHRSQSPVTYERQPAAMPPPRAPPRRIIVDAFGREYLEPARSATVVREEVTAEPRSAYERVLPPRAISLRHESLGDEAVLYRPASPAYAAPRRVVTQPEYYREPSGPGLLPDPPREYITRASSVRPAVEPPRYEVPLGYERSRGATDDRLPPPPPPRDYYRAVSARPAEGGASRYDAPVAYERRPGLDEPISRQPVREFHHPAAPPPPPIRSASVRPAAETTAGTATVRYEMPGTEYGAVRRVDYAPPPAAAPASTPVPAGFHHHDVIRRETMPPPPHAARAYSVNPGEQVVRREYAPVPTAPPAERYYGRPPPPVREDEEVVYLDRPPLPRDGYR